MTVRTIAAMLFFFATNAAAMLQLSFGAQASDPLHIQRQGIFSSGGSVTLPLPGKYDETQNWLDKGRAGNTAHVDHANVLYQLPVNGNGHPIVFLHGYGQSRMGWMTMPDGREGWSDFFLRKGYGVFLVDQPRRGEAGSTKSMATWDSMTPESKDYMPGDQAWYTHFRIGRTAPERYAGSQFPQGDKAQDQFFRQMTPNTGDYDEPLFGRTMGAVLNDVFAMTGKSPSTSRTPRAEGSAGPLPWSISPPSSPLSRASPRRSVPSITKGCWRQKSPWPCILATT